MAFTEKQREWILGRAGRRCEFETLFPGGKRIRCGGEEKLLVCHIIPPLWGNLWFPNRDIDTPTNGIVLCRYHLQLRYPELSRAFAEYRDDQEAFKALQKEWAIKAQQHQVYWNARWDFVLEDIARRETARWARHNPYPRRSRAA